MTTLVTLTGTPISLRFVNCFTLVIIQILFHVLRSWAQQTVWLHLCGTAGHQKKTNYHVSLLISEVKWLASYLCFAPVTSNTFCQGKPACIWHTLPVAVECWHIVFTVTDFHQNIKKLESPCGNQSDDCTTLCQQCLWDRPRGTVGFIPSG